MNSLRLSSSVSFLKLQDMLTKNEVDKKQMKHYQLRSMLYIIRSTDEQVTVRNIFFSRKRKRTALHYIKKIKTGTKRPKTIVTPLHMDRTGNKTRDSLDRSARR
jgi:hypothetical protein